MKNDVITVLVQKPDLARALRVLFANPDKYFALSDLSNRARSKLPTLRSFLKKLAETNTIKISKRKKGLYASVDDSHELFSALQKVVLDTNYLEAKNLISEFKPAGKLNVLVLTGVFSNNTHTEIDVLAAGDKVDEKKFNKLVKTLSENTGHELSYVLLDTEEFQYRQEMNDRLIRDIFDFEHKVILDKLTK